MTPDTPLAWGKKVSPAFRHRVHIICEQLRVQPNFLMACMAFESATTFSPSIRNAAGSGATGLIQFMPSTAAALGTSTDDLANMTAEQQLDYVHAYFTPWRGRLHTLDDVYMAILWPAAIGKPQDYVLFYQGDPKRPKAYIQNAGLDYDKDGRITKAECAARVHRVLARGLQLEHAA